MNQIKRKILRSPFSFFKDITFFLTVTFLFIIIATSTPKKAHSSTTQPTGMSTMNHYYYYYFRFHIDHIINGIIVLEILCQQDSSNFKNFPEDPSRVNDSSFLQV